MALVRFARILLPLVCLAVASGCSTLPNGRLWGEDATVRPGWERVQASAIGAARDPWVWVPLVAAAGFQIDDWDHRVSDWAREHTPVFGTQQSAENWSDDLRKASVLAHYATILATPGGDDASEWLLSKAKGTLVGVAAVSATGFITLELKDATDRERPNGAAEESFPSGHTTSAAVHTRLGSRNLRSIDMSPPAKLASEIALHALTFGTSWARIEAGWHYPSDTLIAMALGNFMAAFVNDAFLGLDDGNSSIALSATGEGAMLQWSQRF